MHALTVVAAFLGGGATVTFIGAKLIERAHPPGFGRAETEIKHTLAAFNVRHGRFRCYHIRKRMRMTLSGQ